MRRAVPWARLLGVCVLSALALAGCAHAPQPPTQPGPDAAASAPMSWRGRLALRVQPSAPQQEPAAFFASFELSGQPQAGSLLLLGPLGTALAQLRWDAHIAVLSKEGQERAYASLEELVTEVTGAALPVAALFDWLQGRAAPAPGWSVDLSRLAEGRLTARREHPPPAAELRLILDSP